ncbi:MAG: hypothetical protein HY585_04935 [Candidatus Omnitrophica bacterium]|nr:hypothetical protein [Candidatus Omnitrophota bacterium]
MKLLIGILFVWLIAPNLLFAQSEVSGRVVFEGAAPRAQQIQVKSEMASCGTMKEVRPLVLGKNNGVANTVVTLLGASGSITPKDGLLDQIGCEFTPHVQVLPLNSTLKVTSSDPVLHNTHGFYEDGSTAFNVAIPIAGTEIPVKLKRPGVIKIRCDAGHTWMGAYVVVTDQPFYAVTDAGGNFKIEGIRPGTYEIEVWQEWIGKHREPITVQEGSEPVTITLRKS